MRCEHRDRECYACGQCEPKRKQIHTCFLCDEPIYEGDIYYDVGDVIYCRHCVEEGRKTA
ncbi:MAG: hypothetical protein J6S14_04950 [Clostridia bacterium]|nr:hypothetical protein [Clostridia bacterium]